MFRREALSEWFRIYRKLRVMICADCRPYGPKELCFKQNQELMGTPDQQRANFFPF